MTFSIRAADNKVVAAPANISAPVTEADVRRGLLARRDWRKRRKVRARRSAELRGACDDLAGRFREPVPGQAGEHPAFAA